MNAIGKLREKKKISQTELADILNITQGAVSQWELGLSRPTSKILPELAKALDCTIDELFKEEKEGV